MALALVQWPTIRLKHIVYRPHPHSDVITQASEIIDQN